MNKGKRIGRIMLCLVVSLMMVMTMIPRTSMDLVYADVGETPAHDKSVDSNGDGTYTIELSVTGDADTEVETAANVNVLVIYDESSSMTSNNVSTNPNRNRADYAEDIMHDFIANLRQYQKSDDPTTTDKDESDNIQVALVGFGPNATTRQGWTSNLGDTGQGINRFFDDGVDGTVTNSHNYTSNNGTNWQAATAEALDVLDDADTDPTFVIFVTDGAPTAAAGETTINPGGNHQWTDFRVYYRAATTNAYNIQSDDNVTMFGIYAYGREADLLDDLIYYSNNGSHRVEGGYNINTCTAQQHNFGATEATDNYYNAADTAALTAAIEDIFQTIVEALGVAQVAISDGTTNQVKVGTDVAKLLEVDESSYEYWLSIPVDNNNQFQRIDIVSGEPVTYTVSADGKTVTWPGGSVTVNGTLSGGKLKYEWTEANALYNVAPPEAHLVNGAVDWDLKDAGTLLDGVTYSVTFRCYPSQTTLDYAADIRNDPYVSESNPGAWGDLPPEIQQYIDKNGNLLTNTTTKLSWIDTREDNPQEHNDVFPEQNPVPNDAVEELAVSKDWKNLLDSEWEKPTGITLNVTRDDDPCYTVTLNNGNDWKSKVFISIGIMGADGQPLEGAEGHDFTFTEPTIQGSGYKWEIDVPTVHPMLINNVMTMLVKVDEDHPLPADIDESDVYEFNDATYYVDEASVALTATNERRSSLNLTKVVDGEDAPEDAVFPFTLHVKDPLAPATAPTDQEDPGHDSDYWIWISVRDKNGNRINEGVVGATSDGNGWWYAPNDTDVIIPVKAGYSIRINNVPTGTTYTITEGTVPEGFKFDSSSIAFTEGDTTAQWAFTPGQSAKGSIDTTNAVFTVTFKNTYELNDVKVNKFWDDNSNQDGKRPETLTLTLNGAPAGTAVPAPVITTSEDGNTWTYVWEDMPRYDSSGNEITYTVTEGTVPDGYTCETTTVNDGGTITNTHTPETTEVTVVKVWEDSDDIGEIRPTSIQAQLKADGTESGSPVTLNDDNEWTYTWENLPKYKNGGTEIVYTADETAVPTGYEKSGPEKTTAEDGTITFTVTNTYNPTPVKVDPPVQKVITGNEDLYNGDDFTFVIAAVTEGAPMPANTQITNSADYELDNKPGYYEFGEITFTKPGEYEYKITESGKVDGVTNDKDAAAGKTITFTVEDDGKGNLMVTPTTDQVQLAFTNVYDANGEATLVVTKELAGAAWPAGKSLTFTVAGKDNAPMPEKTTATLTSAGNVSFGPIAYGLSDAGKTYEYTITESSFGKGWTGAPDSITATVAVVDNGDGTLGTTVTYTPDTAKFTNTYKASGKATIEATKALVGAAWPTGKSLTFTLSGTESAPMPAQGGETVTLTEAGKATFGEIAYTEADAGKTYTYTISEEDGFGGAWTGSGDITATVKVTDNGDGTLATEVTYDPTSDTITNTYKAEGTTEIKVTKKLAGTVWPAGKSLTFTLTGSDGAPMPETTTATLTAAGDVTFGPIALDEADAGKTYTYTVSEGTGFGGAWTGSGDVTATVVVTDDGAGKVTGAVTYSPENATITNTYKATGSVALEATKAIAGAAWPKDKSITFALAGEGGTLPETTTVTLTEAGKATFGAITYTEADIDKTYTYTISEDGFGDGWTGSGDIKATVKVTDNGDGTLKTDVTYSPEDKTITNTYAATGSATLKASKFLQGRAWMESESFTFTLKDPNGIVVDEQTVTADGEVTFDTINYNEADAGKSYTYTIEETGNSSANVTASDPVTATVAITDNGDGTLATAVTYSPEEATIINTYEPTPVNAQINVHKTIEGFLEGQPDATFEFTLYDKDGVQVGEPITITTVGGTGSKSFAPITYTAVGDYTYTVKETKGDKAGYIYDETAYPVTVKVTDDPENGKLLADVSYGEADATGEAPTAVDVVNQFDMKAVDVTLTLTKTIDDQSNSAPDGTFNFTLYKDSVSEENYVEETSITTEDLTGSVDFKPLTFDKSGEYTYVVVEEAGDVNGFTYDTTVHTYKIVIDDNFDAAILEVDEEGSTLDATITNVYKATATSTVLKVKKEIEDTSGSAYETTFTFTLTGADGSPMPEEGGDTVTVTGPEEGAFGEIAYEKAGTYEYTITEVAGDAAGYQYDSTEYKVNVTVEDQNGQLVATAAYMDKEGKSQTNLTITNTYDPEDAKITLKAEKTVDDKTGGAAGNPKTFTFELLDEDGNVIETVTRQGGGTVTFSELTYSKVGKYSYTIREAAGSDSGYTYDTNEYGVIVTVTDPDKDGILKAAITAGDSVEFVNPYEAKPCGTEIELTKKLTGRDLEDGEFEFTLVDITGGGSEELQTVYNNEKGNISFDYIEYNMPGTYVYEVYEAVPEETNGVEYDQSIEVVTVKVTDDGNGQLSLTVTYGGDKTFENTYNAEGSFEPEVTKRLEGKDLKDGQFTFTLVGPDGQTYTAKNDAEGKVVFEALDFDLNDAGQTYEYTITEVNDGQANIKYDEHAETLTVTIKDNGDGTLQISDEYSGKATFTNKYEEPPAPPTGDTTVVVPYIVIGISALILLLMLLFRTRKNRA